MSTSDKTVISALENIATRLEALGKAVPEERTRNTSDQTVIGALENIAIQLEAFKNIASEVRQMNARSETVLGALENMAAKLGALSLVPAAAQTDAREELIVRYTLGEGMLYPPRDTTSRVTRITVKGQMYTLNGEADGHWEGVDAPVAEAALGTAMDLTKPESPQGPFNEPAPPVAEVEVLSWAKGLWTFGDGSTITAIGPANIRIVFYITGASQLWITANQIITNGTKRFAGAQGLKTVAGSSWVEPGRRLDQAGP